MQNILLGSKLSEFHTGYRAFSRRVLETLPLARNSDDFVFDNQMLVQALAFGMRVGEISCPTRYFAGSQPDQLPAFGRLRLRRALDRHRLPAVEVEAREPDAVFAGCDAAPQARRRFEPADARMLISGLFRAGAGCALVAVACARACWRSSPASGCACISCARRR